MDCLIVTNRRDLTSDYIVRELKRRSRSYFRLNTETLTRFQLSINIETDAFDLHDGERTVRLREVRSAYFRRPRVPELPSADQDLYSDYRRDEWLSLLKSLYLFLEDRWLSHPSAIPWTNLSG